MATVKCPSCARPLEVDDAYRDWTVRCPHCGHEFVPDGVDRPPPAPGGARPRRRPRDDDDDDHDRYERDDEPRAVPERVREEALHLVSAPATWLEICGWLTALGSIGVAALCLVLGMEQANNPPPNANQNDDIVVFLVLGCCGCVLGVPYGVAMAIGARNMRTLGNRGWAMAAAILGVAAFSLFSCWGVIHTAIGAWALIALDKPAVREAFGLPRRRDSGRRRRRDWDD